MYEPKPAVEKPKKTSLQLYLERLLQEHPKGPYYSYFQKRIKPMLEQRRSEKSKINKIPSAPPQTDPPDNLPNLPTPQKLACARKRWKRKARLIPPSRTRQILPPTASTPELASFSARASSNNSTSSPQVRQLIIETGSPKYIESRGLRKWSSKNISHRMTEFLIKKWNLIMALISALVICCLIVMRRKRRKGSAIRSAIICGSRLNRTSRERPKVKRRRRVIKRC